MTDKKDWNPWGNLEENNKESEEDKLKRVQLNKDHFNTYSTESGKRVLEYYKAHTLDALAWFPGAPEHYSQWRAGQNTVLKEMVDRTHKSKQEE